MSEVAGRHNIESEIVWVSGRKREVVAVQGRKRSARAEVPGQKQSSASAKPSTHVKRLFVVGIDLGTSYSGWAYSTLDDPKNVHVNTVWYSGEKDLVSQKTPTCVLLNPDKTFKAFGYEAETTYTSLAEEKRHHDYLFFRNFKMSLYENHASSDLKVLDIGRREMPLIEILKHSIQFLKDHFLKTLHDRVNNANDSDITYVLTVPAIWTPAAMQLMKDAARKAKILANQLIIAHEPEAASLWCQHLQTEISRSDGGLGAADVGTQYMIVDMGGGTADITIHEKGNNGKLKELHKVNGGPWGGHVVEKNFMNFLESIVGGNAMREFTKTQLEDVLELSRSFESKKRTIGSAQDAKVMIKIPVSLKEIFEKSGRTIQTAASAVAGTKVVWKVDKLRVDPSIITKCFDDCLNNLITHISGLLAEPNMAKVQTIILVGGMAESEYVKEKLKNCFGGKRFIIPPECGLSVVQGAALFGRDPNAISA